ncbi:outer membrane beta-barrel protein [Amorphus orientalis]|uniref:Opacity protein-like surface antigen n=1 Tax=Amorphus orientalis TaxID=649198 RepID=A0AAE3VNJ3_9HYPH|nr:outer membrane beta-barrel protein [Amorphus orientalis]MDQ0315338.1 opacity protein-like surface antigen [Amorphus orientalis]
MTRHYSFCNSAGVRSACALLAAVGLLALESGRAEAADPVEPAPVVAEVPASAWTGSIAPYVWMSGLSGTTANFGAPSVHIDQSFSDIVDALDFSLMLAGQARYGRFSVSTDFLYLKTTSKNATPFGRLASTAKVGTKTLEFTALAGYALVDNDKLRLDVVGGARFWNVENALSFQGGRLDGIKVTDNGTWVDAMGGLKGRFDMTERAYLTGWALAGAGGADFGWDVLGGVGYDLNDRFSAVAGYRAAGVDYQSGTFEYDVTIQGPILGVVYRF